ncbi:chymotrypsin inhibitor Ani s 6-like [Cotesia typhae]|uniref:chymotrypsin inhibitor Ani s 6-like n=1 Tax=Cotesia typhae TaxID=2053667 RepID=UPI003D6926C2
MLRFSHFFEVLLIASFFIHVYAEECSEPCSVNEECSQCGAECELSCSDTGPKICPAVCLPAACICQKGFVRDKSFDSCVRPDECFYDI